MFKDIYIKKLVMKGFKGFKDLTTIEFNLEGKTTIEADNYRGKTSIGEAIVWAFLGSNLWGNDRADRLLLNDESRSMSVAIDFTANGKKHYLSRTRRGNQTTIILDNYNIRQNELSQQIGNKQIFLSIFNLEYFNNMTDKEGRDFLISILGNIPIEDVIEKIDEMTLSFIESDLSMVHGNPNYFMKEKRAEIRELKDDISYTEGQLSEIEIIETNDTVKEFDLTKIKELENQLENLNSNPNQEMIRKMEALKEEKIQKEIKLSVLSSEKIENTDEVQKIREQILSISNEKIEIKDDDKEQIILLRNKLNELREQYRKKRELPLEKGDNCPTCKTLISEPHIEILKEEMEIKLHNLKEEGNATSLKLNQLEKNTQESINKLNEMREKKRVELQGKYNDLKTELEIRKAKKIKTLKNEIMKINNNIKELEEKQEQELKGLKQKREIFKEELLSLNKEKAEVDAHNMKVKFITEKNIENQKKLKEYTAEIERLTKAIAFNGSQINAAKLYTSTKAKLLSSLIHNNLTDVSIELQKVIESTGELKDAFEIRYKGRGTKVLSTSEKIRVGLEIANLIINQLGLKYPIFVDNSESITHYNAPKGVQIIETKVVKDKELFQELNKAI